MSGSEDRQLWTAWCDYFATGEGRSIMACIAYASSADEMKERFVEKFDDWFGKGCEVENGVVRSELTRFLWSEAVLTSIEDCGKKRGWVDAHSWFHFSFS